VCRQTGEKGFKKKLKNLHNQTNDKDKEFLKGLMDDKEKWSLTHDKGGKCCGYMASYMTESFNSLLRGVWSFPVTPIASFTFYKCNEWFVKRLVDAQMVKRDHSDYGGAPNIYLDIKRNEARVGGMHSTCFYIRIRKYEVNEGGGTASDSEHRGAKQFLVKLSENTCTCGVLQLIHVPSPHVIVVRNILDQNYNMFPLWPITLCWKRWFRLGPVDLYSSWMKCNESRMMVLDMRMKKH
jgi:hypothetical protein